LAVDLNSRLLEMKAALVAEGVAITPRRGKLLEVLVASERHLNVNDIHQEVKRSFPGTSLATVYNTIELLKETGQVLEIEFSGVANRYDGRRPQAHPHLVCTQCEKIEDLDSIEPDGSLDDISRATGYQVVSQRTDYYGVCPKCQGSK
jgi:Fur family peroxide stress response transcriptional regulator